MKPGTMTRAGTATTPAPTTKTAGSARGGRLLTHRVLLLFHTQLGRSFGSSGFAAVADPMVAD
jgi:hypothetical protein